MDRRRFRRVLPRWPEPQARGRSSVEVGVSVRRAAARDPVLGSGALVRVLSQAGSGQELTLCRGVREGQRGREGPGAHTRRHPNMPLADPGQVAEPLETSSERLSEEERTEGGREGGEKSSSAGRSGESGLAAWPLLSPLTVVVVPPGAARSPGPVASPALAVVGDAQARPMVWHLVQGHPWPAEPETPGGLRREARRTAGRVPSSGWGAGGSRAADSEAAGLRTRVTRRGSGARSAVACALGAAFPGPAP